MKIPNLRNGNAPELGPKQPKDFILEANAKAAARTNVVAVIAERLFNAQWKELAETKGLSDAVIVEAIDECIHVADIWQDRINAYQNAHAERIHNAAVERATAAGLILPTWGEIKDHFPAADAMFPEQA